MKKKSNKNRATYYLMLPVSMIEEWESIRQERGYEKCYMATQAFRHYIDTVLNKKESDKLLDNDTATTA